MGGQEGREEGGGLNEVLDAYGWVGGWVERGLPDDELVDLVDEGLNHGDLGGDLWEEEEEGGWVGGWVGGWMDGGEVRRFV